MTSLATRRALIFAASLILGIFPVNAQINPNSGPLVQPLQKEPTIGLPDQAPSPSGTPAVPPAPSTQRATPRIATPQPAQEAAAASDWQSECGKDNLKDHCQAIVRSRVRNQVVLVLAIARQSRDARPRLQMALPLGINIARGVKITIGEFNEDLSISRCTAQGCLVEGAASDELLAALRQGSTGRITVYSLDDNAIDLNLPLTGAASSLEKAKVFS